MSREVKSWRPGHWSVTKRRMFQDHLYRFMDWQLQDFLGPYEGAKLAAQLRAQRRAQESLEALRSRGIATIGSTAD